MSGTTKAFTLVEMAVAMAIGLIIVNMAYASISFSQKFIAKTKLINDKNSLIKAALIYAAAGNTPAGIVPYTPENPSMIGLESQELYPATGSTTAGLIDLFIGEPKRVLSQYAGPQIPPTSPDPLAGYAVLSTTTPHGLTTNQCFQLTGMQNPPPGLGLDPKLNDFWTVAQVIDKRTILFGYPASTIPNRPNYYQSDRIGVLHKGHGKIYQYSRSAGGEVTIVAGSNHLDLIPGGERGMHGLKAGNIIIIETNNPAPSALELDCIGRFVVKKVVNSETFIYDSPGTNTGTGTSSHPGFMKFHGYQANLVIPKIGN